MWVGAEIFFGFVGFGVAGSEMKSRARSSGADSRYGSIRPPPSPHFRDVFLVVSIRFAWGSDWVSFAVVGWWWCRLSVRKSKAEKDPNKPKRPPSAFFVFM